MAAHVHKGVEEVTEDRRRTFEGDDEGVATELLVSKIQQGNNATKIASIFHDNTRRVQNVPFTKIHRSSAFAINVEGFRLVGK